MNKCLQNAKKPRLNLGKEQREALRKLKEDDSIVILPADKGNAIVVMNKEDYDKKMKAILDGGDYAVVRTNPTPKLDKKLNVMLRELWEKEINKTGMTDSELYTVRHLSSMVSPRFTSQRYH